MGDRRNPVLLIIRPDQNSSSLTRMRRTAVSLKLIHKLIWRLYPELPVNRPPFKHL
jgi:hypothetical protein